MRRVMPSRSSRTPEDDTAFAASDRVLKKRAL
jgi:hypothetical protein